jgi:hypothetical protein
MLSESKQQLVVNYIKSQLGDPIVKSITEESDTIQTAINNALVSYWLAFPYTWRTNYSSAARGTVVDTVQNITNNAFMDQPAAQASAYFLGVSRIEDGALGAIGNNIDSYLLGVPYPNPSYKVYPGSLDLAEIVRYRTEVSIITGEIEVEYDEVLGVIRYITPNAYGQFTAFYAFGFDESVGLQYLPNRQIDLFRKMACVNFLDIVISARSNIAVNADFKLDMTALTKKRDDLQEKVDKEVTDQMIIPIYWG